MKIEGSSIIILPNNSTIWKILTKGKLGETYLVGSNCEKTNLEIIYEICKILNKNPDKYISFVEDRLGHDFRYAINSDRITKELKWKLVGSLITP